MIAGFWQTTFFLTDFWHEDFWQDTGIVSSLSQVRLLSLINILEEKVGTLNVLEKAQSPITVLVELDSSLL